MSSPTCLLLYYVLSLLYYVLSLLYYVLSLLSLAFSRVRSLPPPSASLRLSPNSLVTESIPSLLSFLSYVYFVGGCMVGPVFPIDTYMCYVRGSLMNVEGEMSVKSEKNVSSSSSPSSPSSLSSSLPSPLRATVKRVLLSVVYLVGYHFLSSLFPVHYMTSTTFLTQYTLLHRLAYVWIACKVRGCHCIIMLLFTGVCYCTYLI